MFVNNSKQLSTKRVLVLTLIFTFITFIAIKHWMSSRLLSVDYKVFGRVQGVFFRKSTKRKADELGLFGWVMNARDGTVVGTAQGLEDQIVIMKHWLQSTGSRGSRIDRCLFTNERVISDFDFNAFEVRY